MIGVAILHFSCFKDFLDETSLKEFEFVAREFLGFDAKEGSKVSLYFEIKATVA